MNIKSGDIFRHYKGGIYTILHIGYDANNNRQTHENVKVVVYMDHKDQKIWIRYLSEFIEPCKDGTLRFEKIS